MPTRFAFPAQLIALVLSKETAAAQAIALCRLEPGLAAAIFKSYSEDIQEQVIIRITTIASEGAQAITELEQASTPELKAILLNELVGGLDGMQTTARLLRHLSRERETAILQAIRKQDSDLADAVQEHRELVTFADMEHLTDREIQLVLGEIDIRDLAVALKGVSEKLMDRLLANVSESDREVVADEMKYSGPVRITDVEEVQRRIAKTVQALEEKNEVATLRGEPHRFV
jgi:flagellar motor switch protein FliG